MATFQLSVAGSAAAATARIGLQPDSVREHTNADGKRGTCWGVSNSPSPVEGTELSTHLVALLDRLEPVAPALGAEVEAGAHATWFCYLGSRALEHAAELDRGLLRRLTDLPGDLLLDVYGDD